MSLSSLEEMSALALGALGMSERELESTSNMTVNSLKSILIQWRTFSIFASLGGSVSGKKIDMCRRVKDYISTAQQLFQQSELPRPLQRLSDIMDSVIKDLEHPSAPRSSVRPSMPDPYTHPPSSFPPHFTFSFRVPSGALVPQPHRSSSHNLSVSEEYLGDPFMKVIKRYEKEARYGIITHHIKLDSDVIDSIRQGKCAFIVRYDLLNRLFSQRMLIALVNDDQVECPSLLVKKSHLKAYITGNFVDISSYLRCGGNTIQLDWHEICGRVWVEQCQKCDLEEVHREITKLDNSKLWVDPAVDDADISMDEVRLSLSCPLSLKHIDVPVRGINCHHKTCFDLDSFLSFGHHSGLWECPICSESCPPMSLRVDTSFDKILKATSPDDLFVLLKSDGSFEVDNDPLPYKKTRNEVPSPAPNKPEEDVIVLDDDDDGGGDDGHYVEEKSDDNGNEEEKDEEYDDPYPDVPSPMIEPPVIEPPEVRPRVIELPEVRPPVIEPPVVQPPMIQPFQQYGQTEDTAIVLDDDD